MSNLVYVAGYGPPVQAYSEGISPSRYFHAMFVRISGADLELKKDPELKLPKLILDPKYHEYEMFVPVASRTMINEIIYGLYQYRTYRYGYNVYERINSAN